ncbi:L-lactate dehydrogenase [Microlunatus ginsengisoli]|uniref:L-lactate dehydrogenase n=1 Tax=Microlunatus ginsengisoli TaxID=363863 RepID=A0ABP6ZVX5_9ACTN
MAVSLRRSKLAIVGAGSVGATLAYASLIKGVAHDIVLYDVSRAKVTAEVLDLRHGLQFCPPADIDGSDDIAVCAGADVIAITAGAKQKPGQTRLELAEVNVGICRDLIPRLLEVAPDCVLLLVTNPVDVLTMAALEFSGLGKSRVLGSGTVLDSARLRQLIASSLGVASQSVHAWIAGEHGDTEFPVWSSASIGTVPIADFVSPDGLRLDDVARERIGRDVVTAAEQIIRGKGATNYAVGLAATRVIEAILRDEKAALPISSLIEGQHGVSDVCLSLPSLVDKNGVMGVLDVPMSEREIGLFQASADAVKAVARSVGLGR